MDQRNRTDRRHSSGKRPFPFKDRNGEWVSEDRRRLPDRRMEGIAEGGYSLGSEHNFR